MAQWPRFSDSDDPPLRSLAAPLLGGLFMSNLGSADTGGALP